MNKNDVIIRLETEKDYRETENVTREAFWNVYRPGCLEHYVLNQLRDALCTAVHYDSAGGAGLWQGFF